MPTSMALVRPVTVAVLLAWTLNKPRSNQTCSVGATTIVVIVTGYTATFPYLLQHRHQMQ
jgi:cytochrome bd-type quinol oxidase subunit 2